MAKFYDFIDLTILCQELIKRNFPKPLMVTGFFVHAAPRILRVGKCFGPVIHSCGKSILAGCQLSCSFARGMLWELTAKLATVDPEYPCAQHLDDLSHVLVGETEGGLKSKLVKAGKIVGEEVLGLKLALSEKSTIVPENQTTKAVVKILNAAGIPMKTASTCDDVGVQMSGPLTRRVSTLNARISKGSKRASRTADLVKINPKAKQLTMAATAKVQPYGHQAQGACMTQQFAMRANIKKTTPFAGS